VSVAHDEDNMAEQLVILECRSNLALIRTRSRLWIYKAPHSVSFGQLETWHLLSYYISRASPALDKMYGRWSVSVDLFEACLRVSD